jgi:double-stranded uracil-DNA glycosylase
VVGFTRAELERYRDRVVPDLIGDVPPRLVFVGINPGLWTAASGAHFAHPGNRFYPALLAAGLLDRRLDVSAGYDAAALAALHDAGIGITNLAPRPTARADELTDEELRAGVSVLEGKVERWAPAVVAFVGLTAYRTAYGLPGAGVGRQDHTVAGAPVWALPNPSGLNAHYQLPDLARWYRAAAADAVLDLGPLRV